MTKKELIDGICALRGVKAVVVQESTNADGKVFLNITYKWWTIFWPGSLWKAKMRVHNFLDWTRSISVSYTVNGEINDR